jgi:cytochrome P450
MSMALHPEVQRRAQAEIDSVVGRERLPVHADRVSMPYVEAICREILRWRVVTPLGINRASLQADIYDGMLIPKGMLLGSV